MNADPGPVCAARAHASAWRSGWRRALAASWPLLVGLCPGGVPAADGTGAPATSGATQAPMTAPAPRAAPPSARPAASAADDRLFQDTLLSAEQGDVDSMVRLAQMYETGSHSAARDTTGAQRWLLLASALGNGLASYKLHLYHAGRVGGEAKALKYKALAARQGYFGPVNAASGG